MRILHQLTHKFPNFSSPLCISSRFLTTQKSNPIFDQPPSSAYYDVLIDAAGRNRDFAAVQHLLNKRAREGFFNTSNTFNFISTDLSVVDALSETLSHLDRGFSQKGAYDALVARLCKLQRTDKALSVAEDMVRRNYGANACTFHPILNALTRKKMMDKAWSVVDWMKQNRIPPDLTAYNYLLTAYCFTGDLTSTAGLLKRMEEEGLGADSRTYDALVLGACRAGKVEGAMVVLRRMEDEGVIVLYSTYVHVIGGLLKLGYYAQVVEFVMITGGKDKWLDTESFGILGSRLIHLKRFNEAKFVLGEMRKRGLKMCDKLSDFYDLHISE